MPTFVTGLREGAETALHAVAPSRLRTPPAACLAGLLLLVLAGCGAGGGDTPDAPATTPAAAGPKTVEIKLTDAGCEPATIKLEAGRTTFKITNAGTDRVSEVEVLSGRRILGEKENLVAGLSGSFTLDLKPGQYRFSCPGGTSAATGVVTVAGEAAATRTPT